MKKLEYSALVRKKLVALKERLAEQFDVDIANKVLAGMMTDADKVKSHSKIGTSIA